MYARMSDCLFCRIASGEIPAKKFHEDAHSVGFWDIHPQAPKHGLLIPKKHVATLNDADPEDASLLGHLLLQAARLAKQEGFADAGYRTVINCNENGGQTVFHVHVHVMAGRPMAWPPG